MVFCFLLALPFVSFLSNVPRDVDPGLATSLLSFRKLRGDDDGEVDRERNSRSKCLVLFGCTMASSPAVSGETVRIVLRP